MEKGKISEKILNRSITNLIGRGPVAAMDAAVYEVKKPYVLTSTQAGDGETLLDAALTVYKAANNIYASGGRLMAIQTAYILPEKMKERDIKALTRQLIKASAECGTYISGGHTQVSDKVAVPVVTITAIGSSESEPDTLKHVKPGWQIVLSKWVGLEQTAVLLNDSETYSQLTERFSEAYFDEISECASWLLVDKEAYIASCHGAAMHDVSDDGIFGALWDLAEASDSGFVVDVHKIPIRQQTVEICTYLSLDAYRIKSSGCLMMVCENGDGLVEALNKEGIPATVIGYVTDNKDKIIKNGDETRFLDKK